MNVMEKWKRAVIHLECAGDSISQGEMLDLTRKFQKEEISPDEFGNILVTKTRDLRYQGTAVFLVCDGCHYLVTARHVVHDNTKQGLYSSLLSNSNQKLAKLVDELDKRAAPTQIFSIIFRVPSLEEVFNEKGARNPPKFLMNLGAGVPWLAPYTFSSPELDLAIISLEQRDFGFAKDLVASGYSPISLSDIADEPSVEGAEVFTVGYPSAITQIGELNLSPDVACWASRYVSMPAFTFGRISMLHGDLPFYWCDMNVCTGNSGGPLIENGKLVGIMTAQAGIYSEIVDQDRKALPIAAKTRMPFGKVIKAKFIRELLEVQGHKDATIAGHGREKGDREKVDKSNIAT